MEKENKSTILSDQELKDVTGGAAIFTFTCHTIRNPKECMDTALCKWTKEGRCVGR